MDLYRPIFLSTQCPSSQSLYWLNNIKEDYKMEKSVMFQEKGLQDAYPFMDTD